MFRNFLLLAFRRPAGAPGISLVNLSEPYCAFFSILVIFLIVRRDGADQFHETVNGLPGYFR